LEQQVLNESVGSQDQIAAAYGGFNVIRLATKGNIHVEPVKVSQTRLEALESRLLLFYTGTSRFAPDMAARIIAGLRSRAAVMQAIHGTFDRGLRILSGDGDLDEFGELLHEAWLLKKQLSPTVSTPGLESLYSTATRHGALGGKVLGAGGGGFVMLYVPPERQPLVIDALAPYLRVPVRFERRGCHALVSEGDAPMPAGIVSPVL
jgi:D-glycero-alpha-D-manno-heptose-7-phosphate kinase